MCQSHPDLEEQGGVGIPRQKNPPPSAIAFLKKKEKFASYTLKVTGHEGDKFILTIELLRYPLSPSSTLWSIPLPSSGLCPTGFSSGEPCSFFRVYYLLPAHVQGKMGQRAQRGGGYWGGTGRQTANEFICP